MTDLRAQLVADQLLANYDRMNYAIDLVTQGAQEPTFKGQTMQFGSLGDLTVYADGDTDQDAQALTSSVVNLTVDKFPWVPLRLDSVPSTQNLNGNWQDQVGVQALMKLRNDIDNKFVEYLTGSAAWLSGSTNPWSFNPVGAAFDLGYFSYAKSALTQQDGVIDSNLICIAHPAAIAAIERTAGPAPAQPTGLNDGKVGVSRVSSILNMPTYSCNATLGGRTATTSAATIASNVLTVTVDIVDSAGRARPHGFYPGQKVNVSGLTSGYNVATAGGVAITSTTATTISLPLTGSDGTAGDGVGVVTGYVGTSLIIDRASVFAAFQKLPKIELVKREKSMGWVMQLGSLLGYTSRVNTSSFGRIAAVHMPISMS